MNKIWEQFQILANHFKPYVAHPNLEKAQLLYNLVKKQIKCI